MGTLGRTRRPNETQARERLRVNVALTATSSRRPCRGVPLQKKGSVSVKPKLYQRRFERAAPFCSAPLPSSLPWLALRPQRSCCLGRTRSKTGTFSAARSDRTKAGLGATVAELALRMAATRSSIGQHHHDHRLRKQLLQAGRRRRRQWEDQQCIQQRREELRRFRLVEKPRQTPGCRRRAPFPRRL